MLDGFRQRERDFEAKFAMDEEVRFRIKSRRNKLLGKWVADKLGLRGNVADAYVNGLLDKSVIAKEESEVFQKIRDDLNKRGVVCCEDELCTRASHFLEDARRYVFSH